MSEKEVFIFEVSQGNFNTSVVLNSYKIPVVVEFMMVWSEPCIKLADSLAGMANEFAGRFIFAKVDIDEQPELGKEYNIENVPTLKVFKDGEVVRSEEGLMEDEALSALLKNYGIYRESDEIREQARQKHMAGDTVAAITLLTDAIKKDPTNTRIAMDMVQIFLDINELEQAKALFEKLPENDKQGKTGQALTGQIAIRELAGKTEGKDSLLKRIGANPDDYDARFDLSICLVAEHDYRQAIDQLFAIFDKNPDYKEGAAREMIINLANILAPNEPELAQEFRRRLGATLA
ncbi:MAG: tetratricopeptide repeat protein, partial [Desulfobacterales bacterium]